MALPNVTKPDVVDGFQNPMDFPLVGEKFDRFGNAHPKDVRDCSAFPRDFECLASISRTLADLTSDPDIWEEIHLEFDGPAAFAGFTPTAFDIE